MSKDELQNNLYWSLLQVSMRAKKNLMKLSEEHSLNIMQLYVLCSMKHGEAVPTNFVASLLACDASTVTGIVDLLFEQKLVTRIESPQDRRVKMLTLTPKGETTKQEILSAIRGFQSNALDGLDEAQKDTLQELLMVVLRTACQ